MFDQCYGSVQCLSEKQLAEETAVTWRHFGEWLVSHITHTGTHTRKDRQQRMSSERE